MYPKPTSQRQAIQNLAAILGALWVTDGERRYLVQPERKGKKRGS